MLYGAGAHAARLRLHQHLLVWIIVELHEVGHPLQWEAHLGVVVDARLVANVFAQQAGVLEVVDAWGLNEVAVAGRGGAGSERGRARQVLHERRAAVVGAQQTLLAQVVVLERAAHEPLLVHAGRLASFLAGRVEGRACAKA